MWYNQYFGDRRIGWLYKFFIVLDFPRATPEEKKSAIRLLKKVLVTTNLAHTDINNLTTTVTPPNLRNLKPLFTDNSLVFYKPGSLASCGVGSVRNSSRKIRKI